MARIERMAAAIGVECNWQIAIVADGPDQDSRGSVPRRLMLRHREVELQGSGSGEIGPSARRGTHQATEPASIGRQKLIQRNLPFRKPRGADGRVDRGAHIGTRQRPSELGREPLASLVTRGCVIAAGRMGP